MARPPEAEAPQTGDEPGDRLLRAPTSQVEQALGTRQDPHQPSLDGALERRTTQSQRGDSDSCHADDAADGTGHRHRVVPGEHGPPQDDEASGERRYDTGDDQHPTSESRVDPEPPEPPVGEGRPQLRPGQGHRDRYRVAGDGGGHDGSLPRAPAARPKEPALHASEGRDRGPFEPQRQRKPGPVDVIQGAQGGCDDAPLGDHQHDKREQGEESETEPHVVPIRPALPWWRAFSPFSVCCPLSSHHRPD